MLSVPFGALHCWLDERKGTWPVINLCHLFPAVLFRKNGGKLDGNRLTQVMLENGRYSRGQQMHGCITQCVTVHGRSPTMSGGMYVISRSWFNDLGGYDVGMDVWGAENLETSFRVSRRSRSRQIVHCVFAASPFCKFTDRDEPARVC